MPASAFQAACPGEPGRDRAACRGGNGRLAGWALSESESCSDFHHWSYGVTVSAVMAAAAAARPLGLPVGMLVPEPALQDYF